MKTKTRLNWKEVDKRWEQASKQAGVHVAVLKARDLTRKVEKVRGIRI